MSRQDIYQFDNFFSTELSYYWTEVRDSRNPINVTPVHSIFQKHVETVTTVELDRTIDMNAVDGSEHYEKPSTGTSHYAESNDCLCIHYS